MMPARRRRWRGGRLTTTRTPPASAREHEPQIGVDEGAAEEQCKDRARGQERPEGDGRLPVSAAAADQDDADRRTPDEPQEQRRYDGGAQIDAHAQRELDVAEAHTLHVADAVVHL